MIERIAFSIQRATVAAFISAIVLAVTPSSAQIPLDAAHDSGQSVTAAYEGWFKRPDGSIALLVGYFNRNLKQVLDIPIGPDNRIEPGGPDRGQPTHFLTRRQWGVFAIDVPTGFGGTKLIWTITANGKTTSVPMGLNPLYEVTPFREAAQGNTPPVLKFEPQGAPFQGPPHGFAQTLTATIAEPLALTLWASDDEVVDPDRRNRKTGVTIFWSEYRGPGSVTFTPPRPAVAPPDGKATTTATFSAPGDYILRAQANDVSGEGGGGFQCCWTNAHVKVTVSPTR